MSKTGIPPQKILASLRQGNPNLQAIYRTIYNAKAKIRKENLMRGTAIQALFDEFAETGLFMILSMMTKFKGRRCSFNVENVSSSFDRISSSIIIMRTMRNSGTDMISNLPSNITDNILGRLPLHEADFRSIPDINHWILFLSKHNLQKLSLRVSWRRFCPLSSHIFSLIHLTHLHLSSCWFKPPLAFRGFSKLVEVLLESVVLEPETFGRFISNCPLLERLGLGGFTHIHALEIDAPKLKFFSFSGTFKSIRFKNCPLLTEVSVSVSVAHPDLSVSENEGTNSSNLIRFFGPLLLIEKFRLQFQTLEAMTTEHVDVKPVVELMRRQETLDLSLNRLKKVKIRHFQGFEPDMEFVKLILASAPVLEKMDIRSRHESDSLEGARILKDFARFHRASAKAEIIYEEP
ncbi:hypothetical protein ACH5RR_030331 [Cinchona calisaya]|uniref:FBD domain-containing protein n=1 Tax=Cinchona calisaya TaxID=153742 RepID=A0ABD2YXS3_9GENT